MAAMILNELAVSSHPCSITSIHVNECGGFICGSYQLIEGDLQSDSYRTGSLDYYSYHGQILSRKASYECDSGVLDVKCSKQSRIIMAAMSDSSLEVFKLDGNEDHFEFSLHANVRKSDEGLFLSLSCDDRNDENTAISSNVAVSTQASSVILYDLCSDGLKEKACQRDAHRMFGSAVPAWVVATDIHESNSRLLSGGDDCQFKLWDSRCLGSGSPQLVNRIHTAGVTSLEWHPRDSNLFASGSYDEQCYVWDIRSFKTPLTNISTGKGLFYFILPYLI